MKKALIVLLAFTGLLLFAFRYAQKPVPKASSVVSRQDIYKHKLILQCSPEWDLLNTDSLASGIGIFQGWGNYPWKIGSKSDSARLYFQQGISMYYAFHIIEAMASFKKAELFDSSSAMIFWAEALAYGPNINDFAYAATPEAFAAAQKAVSLSGACTGKEKALIKAMAVRYTLDSTVSRADLNQLYANEMQKASSQFAHDADMNTLYADALMLQHPWDLWKHDGEAKPWTPAILQILERTLQQSPMHPGANHYYIHAVEASGNPKRALASANRLSKMMPSVSHMVHMPSHIYIRTGLYTEGMRVNEMSVKGYRDYLSRFPDVVNNAPLYLIHNLHMQASCAMMGADYAYSAKAAAAVRASFDSSFLSIPPPFGDFVQYVYMTPVINMVRFGKWGAILQEPEPAEAYTYANLLWHWAKGIALARKNDIEGAKKELQYVQDKKDLPGMLVVMQPFNAPVDAARVAENLLAGIVAEQSGDLPAAVTAFEAAVKFEAVMIYNEPKDWLLPAAPYLGEALLKMGSFSKAEIVFKEDLKENPNNHWSLKGLYESLQKQNKQPAAIVVKKQLDKSITKNEGQDFPVVF